MKLEKQRRLAHVARRYYLEDQKQSDMARELGISRPMVSRLLAEARELGVVEIRIHDPECREAEIPLEGTEGSVSPEEQDTRFEERVQQLMETEGYSRVMAEQTAVQTVARGGQDESQTGMSVRVAAQGAEGNFQDTAQYRWLSRHSIEYGFVFRYPEGKSSYTGREFDPSYIRYVGETAASRMRALQMCLEEYAEYASES